MKCPDCDSPRTEWIDFGDGYWNCLDCSYSFRRDKDGDLVGATEDQQLHQSNREFLQGQD